MALALEVVASRILVSAAVVASLVLIVAAGAVARTDDPRDRILTGDRVAVPTGEVVSGNLHVAAGRVRVDGTVDGDLVVAAGEVRIGGRVTGDLVATGGRISVLGQVDGDLRALAGQVDVAGTVGGDVLVGAGSLVIPGAVGGDVLVGTGDLVISGRVGGAVLGSASERRITGTVGGPVEITVPARAVPTAADRLRGVVSRILSIAVVVALAWWWRPGVLETPADTLRRRPLASLGLGLAGLVALPVVAVVHLTLLVVLSLVFGILLLGQTVALAWLTSLAAWAAAAVGIWVLAAFATPAVVGTTAAGLAPEASRLARLGLAVAGIAVVVAITALPRVGGLVGFVAYIAATGAIIVSAWDARRRSIASPAAGSVE